jgi:hypothetical protein
MRARASGRVPLRADQPPPKYTLQKLMGPTQLLLVLPGLCHGQPVRYFPLAVAPDMAGPSPDAPVEVAMPALDACAAGGCASADWADALVNTPVSASAATDVVSKTSFLMTPSIAKQDVTGSANHTRRYKLSEKEGTGS